MEGQGARTERWSQERNFRVVAVIKSFDFYRFLLLTVAQTLLKGRNSAKLSVA